MRREIKIRKRVLLLGKFGRGFAAAAPPAAEFHHWRPDVMLGSFNLRGGRRRTSSAGPEAKRGIGDKEEITWNDLKVVNLARPVQYNIITSEEIERERDCAPVRGAIQIGGKSRFRKRDDDDHQGPRSDVACCHLLIYNLKCYYWPRPGQARLDERASFVFCLLAGRPADFCRPPRWSPRWISYALQLARRRRRSPASQDK